MDVFEAILTRRSIRRYTPDPSEQPGSRPVTDEQIEKILEAGRWAPSGRNLQGTEYIVIRNKELKRKLSEATKEAFRKATTVYTKDGGSRRWTREEIKNHLRTAPLHLSTGEGLRRHITLEHYDYVEKAQVLIAICAKKHEGEGLRASDAYMAAENMLLAAHALGLGAVIQTRSCGKAANKLLGIPKDYVLVCVMSIGYPAEAPVVTKKPLKEIVHYERFGQHERSPRA